RMSPLRWTTTSLRGLAAELTRPGHRVSAGAVADLLHEEGSARRARPRPSKAGSIRPAHARLLGVSTIAEAVSQTSCYSASPVTTRARPAPQHPSLTELIHFAANASVSGT